MVKKVVIDLNVSNRNLQSSVQEKKSFKFLFHKLCSEWTSIKRATEQFASACPSLCILENTVIVLTVNQNVVNLWIFQYHSMFDLLQLYRLLMNSLNTEATQHSKSKLKVQASPLFL